MILNPIVSYPDEFFVRFEVFIAVRMMMFLWVFFPPAICSPEDGGLKIETVCFSEMLSSTGETTRRQNSEEQVLRVFPQIIQAHAVIVHSNR
jgi:hypothetical protein